MNYHGVQQYSICRNGPVLNGGHITNDMLEKSALDQSKAGVTSPNPWARSRSLVDPAASTSSFKHLRYASGPDKYTVLQHHDQLHGLASFP